MAIKFLSSGNVTGGLTLSGALSGTSATFSGTVTASGTVTLQKSIQLPTTTTGSGTPSDVGVLSFGGNYTTGNRLFVDSSGGTFRIQGSANLILEAPNHNIKNSNGFLILAGDAGVRLFYSNSEKLTTTNTGVKVDGNVKIGLDTMSTPSTNANDIVIDKDASEAGITMMSQAAGSVRWGDASNSSVGSIEYNHNSDYMRFIVNAAERMRIVAAGAVGIDNSSPDSFSGGGSTAASLVIGKGTSGVSPHITLWQGNSAQASLSFASANTGTGQYEGRIRYTRDTGIMDFRTNGVANALVLGSTGNVGIGGTPGQNLDIQKSGARFRLIDGTNQLNMGLWDSVNYRFEGDANRPMFFTSYQGNIYFGISGSTTMTIQDNVGIGATDPEFKLDVKSNSDTAPSAYLRGGKSSQGEIQNTGLIIGTQTTMAAGDYQGISFTGYTSSSAIRRGRAAIGVEAINGPGKMDLIFMTRFADDGTQLGAADEKMRIDSSGNVGIGTDSPSAPLTVQANGGGSAINIIGRNNGIADESIISFYEYDGTTRMAYMLADEGNLDFATGGSTVRMRITSGGDTQLTGNNLDIKGSNAGNTSVRITDSTGTVGTNSLDLINDGTAAYIWNRANTNIRFGINGTERMRITSGGNVNISTASGSLAQTSYKLRVESDPAVTNGIYLTAGTSSSNHAFYVENEFGSAEHFAVRGDGQIRMNASRTGNIIFGGVSLSGVTTGSPTGSAFGMESAGRSVLFQGTTSTANMTLQAFYNPNGQVGRIQTSGSSTGYFTSSDYRLKEDLQDFAGLDMISKIPVYDFQWKIDENRSYGVMAHELQEVLPQAVTGDKDAVNEDESINPQGVDYSKIVPILVKSIQELKAEIELLKKK